MRWTDGSTTRRAHSIPDSIRGPRLGLHEKKLHPHLAAGALGDFHFQYRGFSTGAHAKAGVKKPGALLPFCIASATFLPLLFPGINRIIVKLHMR